MSRIAIVSLLSWPLLFTASAVGHAGTIVVGAGAPNDVSTPETTRVVDGSVVASQSFWRAGRIITRSQVRADDGTEVTFEQIGGSVDEISMIQFPGQAVPMAGDRVSLLVAENTPASGQRAVEMIDVLYIAERADPGQAADDLTAKFVRTTNSWSVPLFWKNSCIFIAYNSAGTSHLAGDDEFAIMDSVFQVWEDATAGRTFLTFELEGKTDLDTDGSDRVNVISFREDLWGPAGCDAPMSEIRCYNPNAAAITTVSFLNTKAGKDRAGEIIDADIEFNAKDFAVSANGVTEADPNECKSDLANTLTHEVGHLMGLDHTCVGSGFTPGEDPEGNPKPWPVDDRGNDVPFCNDPDLPAEIIDSTMNAFQSCGETIKASPAQDDIDAVAGVYPLADDPGVCAIPDEPVTRRLACVCQLGASDDGGPLGPLLPLAFTGLGVLMYLRRSVKIDR